MTYAEKLKSPHWQKKRLKIFERDNWKCVVCGDTENTLHAHHMNYEKGKDPWDYSDDEIFTFCDYCHEVYHSMDGYDPLIVEHIAKFTNEFIYYEANDTIKNFKFKPLGD